MYKGMTIEELINSVVRAEQHAREQQSFTPELRDFPLHRFERLDHQQLVEVA
jgi:hypothetical protein